MNIPILRIPYDDQDRKFLHAGLDEILSSGQLTSAKYTRQFEESFASLQGAKHALAVNSGTSAIEVIIRALGIEGKAIIVPTNTFMATAWAVIESGNRVIFADSDPITFSLDPKDVERRITPYTKAIILVHIGGIVTPAYRDLQVLCRKHNLYLIEDCAHAHGCSIDGIGVGRLGAAGAFSFFPTKVLTTGEGGAVVTDNDDLAEQVMMIRNHGKNPKLNNRMSMVGNNFRMSEVTALIGVRQMQKAQALIEDRRRIAAFYDRALISVKGISVVPIPNNVFSTFYKYLVYLDEGYDRMQLKKHLKEKYQVSLTGEVYTDLCHTEPVWQTYTYCGHQRKADGKPACACWPECGRDQSEGDFPGAEKIAAGHICLPLYAGLSDAELNYVVESLTNALRDLA